MKKITKKPRLFRTSIASLDTFPQCNVPHPDEGFRVCGWKLPVEVLRGTAFAVPREIGVANNAVAKIEAYEQLNRKATELGFKNASHAIRVMEEALKEQKTG
jgi:hypothetical protein